MKIPELPLPDKKGRIIITVKRPHRALKILALLSVLIIAGRAEFATLRSWPLSPPALTPAAVLGVALVIVALRVIFLMLPARIILTETGISQSPVGESMPWHEIRDIILCSNLVMISNKPPSANIATKRRQKAFDIPALPPLSAKDTAQLLLRVAQDHGSDALRVN